MLIESASKERVSPSRRAALGGSLCVWALILMLGRLRCPSLVQRCDGPHLRFGVANRLCDVRREDLVEAIQRLLGPFVTLDAALTAAERVASQIGGLHAGAVATLDEDRLQQPALGALGVARLAVGPDGRDHVLFGGF